MSATRKPRTCRECGRKETPRRVLSKRRLCRACARDRLIRAMKLNEAVTDAVREMPKKTLEDGMARAIAHVRFMSGGLDARPPREG